MIPETIITLTIALISIILGCLDWDSLEVKRSYHSVRDGLGRFSAIPYPQVKKIKPPKKTIWVGHWN